MLRVKDTKRAGKKYACVKSIVKCHQSYWNAPRVLPGTGNYPVPGLLIPDPEPDSVVLKLPGLDPDPILLPAGYPAEPFNSQF